MFRELPLRRARATLRPRGSATGFACNATQGLHVLREPSRPPGLRPPCGAQGQLGFVEDVATELALQQRRRAGAAAPAACGGPAAVASLLFQARHVGLLTSPARRPCNTAREPRGRAPPRDCRPLVACLPVPWGGRWPPACASDANGHGCPVHPAAPPRSPSCTRAAAEGTACTLLCSWHQHGCHSVGSASLYGAARRRQNHMHVRLGDSQPRQWPSKKCDWHAQ